MVAHASARLLADFYAHSYSYLSPAPSPPDAEIIQDFCQLEKVLMSHQGTNSPFSIDRGTVVSNTSHVVEEEARLALTFLQLHTVGTLVDFGSGKSPFSSALNKFLRRGVGRYLPLDPELEESSYIIAAEKGALPGPLVVLMRMVLHHIPPRLQVFEAREVFAFCDAAIVVEDCIDMIEDDESLIRVDCSVCSSFTTRWNAFSARERKVAIRENDYISNVLCYGRSTSDMFESYLSRRDLLSFAQNVGASVKMVKVWGFDHRRPHGVPKVAMALELRQNVRKSG